MDTTEKIAPALSPEEWAKASSPEPAWGEAAWYLGVDLPVGIKGAARQRHGMAALCLWGQTFGFTRTDVRALRAAVESRLSLGNEDGNRIGAFYLAGLADRIEALLPPERA